MSKKRIPALLVIALFALAICVSAQSSSVDYPTPITSSEIKGIIKARDIGDPRLTTHYYVFDGNQGDIFINIETSNLNGDIDVFLAGSLKPLTKFSVYADTSLIQVGRAIYLRKPERLILKIEGRTPIDDPANYTIKFDGSFVAIADPDSIPKDPTLTPEIKPTDEGDVRVNSVGTIVEVKPKPTPEPKTTVARTTRRGARRTAARPPKPKPTPEETAKKEETEPKEEKTEKPEVVVTDNTVASGEIEKKEPVKKPATRRTRAANRRAATKAKKPETETATTPAETKPNPLENVKLQVVLKNGEWISYPMSEVVRVGVDNKGMLTIITKKGEIKRYSILDVSKMTIE